MASQQVEDLQHNALRLELYVMSLKSDGGLRCATLAWGQDVQDGHDHHYASLSLL